MMSFGFVRRGQRWLLPVVVAATVVGALATGSQQANGAELLAPAARDARLEALERELAGVASLQVRFRQERELELLMDTVVSHGVLAFVRPDRLHWEWVSPYPSLLLLNRGRVERFDVVDGQPRRMRAAGEEMMRAVAVQMTRWLQGKFRDSSELFTVEVAAGPPETIVLTPVTDAMARVLQRVEVELGSDPRVARVVLRSPGGDTTVMHFADERRDLELDDRLFDLSRPLLLGGGAAGDRGSDGF